MTIDGPSGTPATPPDRHDRGIRCPRRGRGGGRRGRRLVRDVALDGAHRRARRITDADSLAPPADRTEREPLRGEPEYLQLTQPASNHRGQCRRCCPPLHRVSYGRSSTINSCSGPWTRAARGSRSSPSWPRCKPPFGDLVRRRQSRLCPCAGGRFTKSAPRPFRTQDAGATWYLVAAAGAMRGLHDIRGHEPRLRRRRRRGLQGCRQQDVLMAAGPGRSPRFPTLRAG